MTWRNRLKYCNQRLLLTWHLSWAISQSANFRLQQHGTYLATVKCAWWLCGLLQFSVHWSLWPLTFLREAPEGRWKALDITLPLGKGRERWHTVANEMVGESQDGQVHMGVRWFPPHHCYLLVAKVMSIPVLHTMYSITIAWKVFDGLQWRVM